MNKEWVVTDTHFDHDNIGVYCDRPEGWQDRILRNWRNIVKPEDFVLHLGDVRVGNGNLLDLLNSLPGTKGLVMGNHDTKSATWYMRNGFAVAVDAIAHKDVTFTHHPAGLLFPGTSINVHGHVHNSVWHPTFLFQRLLAIEHVDYRPVDLQKWVNMARSPEKWRLYMKTWKVPVITGKRRRTEDIPLHHKEEE